MHLQESFVALTCQHLPLLGPSYPLHSCLHSFNAVQLLMNRGPGLCRDSPSGWLEARRFCEAA